MCGECRRTTDLPDPIFSSLAFLPETSTLNLRFSFSCVSCFSPSSQFLESPRPSNSHSVLISLPIARSLPLCLSPSVRFSNPCLSFSDFFFVFLLSPRPISVFIPSFYSLSFCLSVSVSLFISVSPFLCLLISVTFFVCLSLPHFPCLSFFQWPQSQVPLPLDWATLFSSFLPSSCPCPFSLSSQLLSTGPPTPPSSQVRHVGNEAGGPSGAWRRGREPPPRSQERSCNKEPTTTTIMCP